MSDDASKPFDVLLLHSPTEDGRGARVIRARPDRVEAGEVRPMREGKPLAEGGEIVKLTPRKADDGTPTPVCDVESVYARPAPPSKSTPGPAQVSTPRFRDNWDRIFGARRDDHALS